MLPVVWCYECLHTLILVYVVGLSVVSSIMSWSWERVFFIIPFGLFGHIPFLCCWVESCSCWFRRLWVPFLPSWAWERSVMLNWVVVFLSRPWWAWWCKWILLAGRVPWCFCSTMKWISMRQRCEDIKMRVVLVIVGYKGCYNCSAAAQYGAWSVSREIEMVCRVILMSANELSSSFKSWCELNLLHQMVWLDLVRQRDIQGDAMEEHVYGVVKQSIIFTNIQEELDLVS